MPQNTSWTPKIMDFTRSLGFFQKKKWKFSYSTLSKKQFLQIMENTMYPSNLNVSKWSPAFFHEKKKKKLLTTEMYVWKFSPYTLRLWFVREFSLLNLIMAKSCFWEKNLLSVRQVGYDKQSEFFKPLSSTLIAITISHLHSVLLYFFFNFKIT